MATLGVYRLAFRSSSLAFSSDLWLMLDLGVRLDPVGFFLFHLCPLEGSSFLVFKMVRAGFGKHFVVVVERKSAKCHSDFCPLV